MSQKKIEGRRIRNTLIINDLVANGPCPLRGGPCFGRLDSNFFGLMELERSEKIRLGKTQDDHEMVLLIDGDSAATLRNLTNYQNPMKRV